jgi:hypothetical protein
MQRTLGLCSLLLGLLFLTGSQAIAQNKPKELEQKSKQEPDQPSSFTFRIPVDVVVVNATVTDKKGNPVKDLAVDDFKIYEDGKPQPIHTFALESYRTVQGAAELASKKEPSGKPESAGSPESPRFFSLVIDGFG